MKIFNKKNELLFEDDSNNMRDCLENALRQDANLQDANLQDAYLRGCNLEYANLRNANLRGCNLEYANLEYANLEYANLEYANLRDANLRNANLRGANLDFSCLTLSCKTLKIGATDRRQTIQLLYHLLTFANVSNDDEIIEKIYNNNDLIELANQFHRDECPRIKHN